MILERLQGCWRRRVSENVGREMVRMQNKAPLISFTFDDFPQSALDVGGAILSKYGFAGTYYTSFGLMNQDSPVGRIFSTPDLPALIAGGHELGCHTFDHFPAWETRPQDFEESLVRNRSALERNLPGTSFVTMSYPISEPRPQTKRRTGKYFACARGGGQTFNVGKLDRNNVHAFFLEQSRDRPALITEMIDRNRETGGWLVFATHDICDSPSRYGATPAAFEEVVRHAADSGVTVLPVAQAWALVTGRGES